MTGTGTHTCTTFSVLRDPNSGTHTCRVSVLLVETSPKSNCFLISNSYKEYFQYCFNNCSSLIPNQKWKFEDSNYKKSVTIHHKIIFLFKIWKYFPYPNKPMKRLTLECLFDMIITAEQIIIPLKCHSWLQKVQLPKQPNNVLHLVNFHKIQGVKMKAWVFFFHQGYNLWSNSIFSYF